ncbi:MAG: NAD(P)H-dependent oxidoreductase [Lawsonibacter sp.]|jgi:FMN-dependent NADH-azoreductase
MTQVLFLDACMRGPEQSRTYSLCRHFLDHLSSVQINHRDLSTCQLPLFNASYISLREQWVTSQPDHPLLLPAQEMANSDLIVVGAPYWDLSFPAALKVYLEWASVLGITFRYDPYGQQLGLSRAKALVYITTAGGPVAGQNYGFDYLKAIGKMFGIETCFCVAAEGLDIWGADSQSILSRAREELSRLAKQLVPETVIP